jgi:uncharacterized protein YndB with AHSA1/START domain
MRNVIFLIASLFAFSGLAAEDKTTINTESKPDFRAASAAKMAPKAAVDPTIGVIIAMGDVAGTPERVYRALITNELIEWWKLDGVYYTKDYKADASIRGPWSVTVILADGKQVHEWGEFCELNEPNKIVMTRRFAGHPTIGDRETTLTYNLLPSQFGTRVTIREEGFIGRADSAYGNAENWEKVLTMLDAYLSKNK